MDSKLAAKTGVLVETPKDERCLSYLVSKKGEDAVCDAVAQLAGNRKPYVSNIARILGVEFPDSVQLTPQEEGRARLRDIKAILTKK
ncbi:hypothetical protein [Paraburkholderia bryophila]|uniref:Uncharacterized protein n=1 Tax=Paraburkholderia bryophila TaxID=420952 RepID=A0A7Z0B764_9BURK|nr:hypothetical protein [Paraburkholderia bryophila]NYH24186.1 hypothetical protein [Paraburkholderia bryophila]